MGANSVADRNNSFYATELLAVSAKMYSEMEIMPASQENARRKQHRFFWSLRTIANTLKSMKLIVTGV
jgi:hypothetical protein